MGLEVIALFVVVLFSVGGLVIPTVTWLLVWQARRQRFLENLRLCGIQEIEELGDEHAEAPIRIRVTAGGRGIDVAAEIRGGVKVWRLRVPIDTRAPAWALRRQSLRRELREARDLPDVERLPGLPSSLELRAADRAQLVSTLGESLPAAAAALLAGTERVLQVAVTERELLIELVREDTSAKAVVRCLKRALAFAAPLGLVEAQPLIAPAAAPAHLLTAGGMSGAPVGTPG